MVVEDYREVNDNNINFDVKTKAKFETDGKVRQLELLITTRQTHPLLGFNWMEKSKFHKLFPKDHTIKNIEVDIQLREGAKLIQQNDRPIPIHLKLAEEKEIEKLKKQGHIENTKNIDKKCFVSRR